MGGAAVGVVVFVCSGFETCAVNPVDVPALAKSEARTTAIASDEPIEQRMKARNTRGLNPPDSENLVFFIGNVLLESYKY